MLAAIAGALLGGDAGLRGELDRARAFERRSEWGVAKTVYESLLPKARRADDRGLLADLLAGLGRAELGGGHYASAVRNASEAADLYARLGRDADRARALTTLGLSHMYLGEYADSLRAYRVALELDQRLKDIGNEVIRRNNIANVYYQQGRYFDAYREYDTALGRAKEMPPGPGTARARQITAANLAALHQRIGQYQRALDLYRDLRASISTLTPSEEGRLVTNIGVLYRRLGDPYLALEHYREARVLFRRDRHPDGEIGAIKNSGIALALDLNDLPRALAEFDTSLKLAKAVSNRREIVQAELYRGEVLRRMSRLEAGAACFQRAFEGAKALNTREDQWKALYGLGQVAEAANKPDLALRQYDEALTLVEAVRVGIQVGSLRSEFLADKRDVYDAAIRLRLTRADPPIREILRMMEMSRARSLQDKAPVADESGPDLGQLTARLGTDTLLLEYWTGKESMAILWLAEGLAGVVHRPYPKDGIGLESFVSALEQGKDWRGMSRMLGAFFLPDIALLRDPKLRHILVVPDGPLHLVPFEALTTGDRLLVERAAIGYLPWSGLLLSNAWRSRPRARLPFELNLIAFGDPVIAQASPILSQPAPHVRLPRSGDEVAGIARYLGRSQVHLGADAQKLHLTKAPIQVPVLHLATHATADSQMTDRSRILFAPAAASSVQDYLLQPEVALLDLSRVNLVTLSACDTERGRYVQGEGVHSFSRTFLGAGAKSTVSTLWRVADGPTAEFMKQFYRRLAHGEAPADALSATKLLFLRSGTELSHPRYWAAFIVSGNTLAPALRLVSWPMIFAATGLLLALAVVASLLNARFRGGK